MVRRLMHRRFPLRLTLAGLLLIIASHGAHAQLYNRFGPANGILKGNSSTPQTTAATNVDVISLFSGTCDAAHFLAGNGTCAVPAGTGLTSVGLAMPSGFSVTGSPLTSNGTITVSTSLNGMLKGNGSGFATAASSDVIGLWTGTCSATTFLRGDGQCVSPGGSGTPGGANTDVQFNSSGSFGGDAGFTYGNGNATLTAASSGASELTQCNSANTSGARCWDQRIGSTGSWTLTTATDAGTQQNDAFELTRDTSGNFQGALIDAPSSGNSALTVNGASSSELMTLVSGNSSTTGLPDVIVKRAGSTANAVGQGPSLQLQDSTGSTTASDIQQSGGQTEFWQYNGSAWRQLGYWDSNRTLNLNAPATGVTLNVNSVAGLSAAQFIAAPGSWAQIGIQDGQTGNRSWQLVSGFCNGGVPGAFSLYNLAIGSVLCVDKSGNITTPSAGSVPWPKTAACWITNTSSTPAINRDVGTIACSGVTKNSTGNYTLSFGAGFSNRPMCTFGGAPSGNPATLIANGPAGTGSSVNIIQANTSGVSADGDFMVICTGR